jgi:hypothetical protein
MWQAKAGDVAGALDSAAALVDGSLKAELLRHIAVAQAKSGDASGAARMSNEAVRAAAGIADASKKASYLRDIAEVQAKIGDIPGALNTAAT